MKVALSFLPLSLIRRPSPPSALGHWYTCRWLAALGAGTVRPLPPYCRRFRAKHGARKITRLPWRPIAPNQIEPNPNRPPSPPPRAGSLSPPTAPKAQPLAPSLPLARGGSSPPTSVPVAPLRAREDAWKRPQYVPLAVGSPQRFSRGKRTRGFALPLRLMGVVFFVAVKSGDGGRGLAF